MILAWASNFNAINVKIIVLYGSFNILALIIRFRPRGARSARADARLCTSSGINLIVPLSFHLVR